MSSVAVEDALAVVEGLAEALKDVVGEGCGEGPLQPASASPAAMSIPTIALFMVLLQFASLPKAVLDHAGFKTQIIGTIEVSPYGLVWTVEPQGLWR